MGLAIVKSTISNVPFAGRKLTGYEGMNNQELIEDFLNFQDSAKTKLVYRGVIEKFDKFVQKPFVDVVKRDMAEFSITIEHLANPTRQRYYCTIRSFFTRLVDVGVIEEHKNPSQGIFKKLKYSKDIASRCLTPTEVELFREAARPDRRKYAMVATLATTGMRISELCDMKWSDMFLSHNQETGEEDWCLRIVGKGNKTRYAFLVEGTLKALAQLRKNGMFNPSDNSYVFLRLYKKEWGKLTEAGAWRILKALGKKAGIRDAFTPHFFRHTFLTQVLAHGASPRDTQFSAGHSSLRTTEEYLECLGTNVSKFYPVQF
jgi:integrase/recombinase XerD